MAAYVNSKSYSEEKIGVLREALLDAVPAGAIVITCGSYARREASQNSDLDFFIITPDTEDVDDFKTQPWVVNAREAIRKIVPIEPSSSGAFSHVERREEMLLNIGGDRDSNKKITRRMLFLLEGEWLFNQEGAESVRQEILNRYIGETVWDHHLALFLLNDIIRYYRTMAVDYEFKTMEGSIPKPWGIRNIKLVFSRKLLYASGLFSVALTANLTSEKKKELLIRLFKLPVIDRMTEICGISKMLPVRNSYCEFLERLADKDTRDHLEKLTRDQRDDPVFRDLKNQGHRFSRELLKLFEDSFDTTHPIRRAVIF
jgi:hypothetical protein